jgi:[protein-PII] uridylyltransferase
MDGSPLQGEMREEEIRQRLLQGLAESAPPAVSAAVHRSRAARHFEVATSISFTEDAANKRSIMRIRTADRPGLLARIGIAFTLCGIRLSNAIIATIGAEVDNSFFITNEAGLPLSAAQQQALEKALLQQIQPRQ